MHGLLLTTILALGVGTTFGLLSYFTYFKPEKITNGKRTALIIGGASTILTFLIGLIAE